MRPAAETKKGVTAMSIGGALFVINDALVKLATETMPLGELLVVRGIFAIACVLSLIIGFGDTRRISSAAKPIVVLRAACEFLVSLCYVTAISQLPIGDLTTIMQATPIIMTILCAVLRIELVDWPRWIAVFIGFAGVLMIAQPGGSNFTLFTLSALASATFVALRDLVTRKIKAEIPPAVVILTTTIFASCGGLLLGLTETWHMPSTFEFSLLGGAAIIVTIANSLMVTAYRYADVSILSPLRYLVVIWAAIMGYIVFAEIPAGIGALGAALIIGGGLYTGYHERARTRLARNQLQTH
jgi:drug/metabolite transporter (DMT)-like permease